MSVPLQSLISRRSLLRAGAASAALAGTVGLASACSSGSGDSLTMAYFGDQKTANSLKSRLLPALQKIDKKIDLSITATNGTDWNDFFAKILTQIAAGTPPDIVGVATEGVQLMAQKGLAIPLDDYVKRDIKELQEYFDDVHPLLVEAMMYQGHLYELPGDFNAGNLYYNTSLFEKAGLAPPSTGWTIDDFHNSAEKIAKLPKINAFDWVVRLWGSWTSFMYANDANLLEEGKYPGGDWLWSTAYKNNPAAKGRSGGWHWGQPTANDPKVVESLDYMIQLRKQQLSPSPDVGGGGTLQGLFAASRIGMTIGGGFWAGGLHNSGMKPGSFDVQYFPKWQVQRALFGTGGYAIFKSSKNKDLAWEVVKQLTKPDMFDVLNPGNATTPVRKSLMTSERYKSTGPQHWEVFYDTLTNYPNTAPIPAPPYYNALATSLNQRTTQAVSSGNAKAALDGMQKDLEAAAKAIS